MKQAQRFPLKVNGAKHSVTTDPGEPLLWVLRDNLKLTGTKFGCGEGVCGACSVLINDDVFRSCVVTVGELDPRDEIVTIEGIGRPGQLSKLQESFIEHTAFGCGYCTPGMIVTAEAFLRRNPSPTRQEITSSMDDNFCRCGSYPAIIDAIESAAGSKKTGED